MGIISILKSKSRLNKEAGLLLFSNEYYDSSVHCYYYSCLQLSIFILITKFNLTYQSLKQEAQAKGENSNNYYINKLVHCITDAEISRKYDNTMHSLKNLRKQADYKPIKTEPSTCATAKVFLTEIEELLNQIQ
jgi:hypothetical protein